MKLFGSGEHLMRVILLFGVGLAGFLGLQSLLVPEGFGRYGHYRAGALDDSRAQPVSFGGRVSCGECHDAQPAALSKGKHAGVGCEACHGPLAAHASDPEALQPVPPDVTSLCVRCHGRASGRPATFPQVDAADHAGEARCTECHAPHAPGEQP